MNSPLIKYFQIQYTTNFSRVHQNVGKPFLNRLLFNFIFEGCVSRDIAIYKLPYEIESEPSFQIVSLSLQSRGELETFVVRDERF